MITLDKEKRKQLRNKENQLLTNLYHNIDTLSKKALIWNILHN